MKYILPLISAKSSTLDTDKLSEVYANRGFAFFKPIFCRQNLSLVSVDFQSLCRWYCDRIQDAIENATTISGSSADFAIVIDRIDISPERFVLIAEQRCWEQLVAILIMVFPEVNFFFCAPYQKAQDQQTSGNSDSLELSKILSKHGISSLFHPLWTNALFDESGLRNFIRNRKVQADDKRFDFPIRRNLAACIDDEQNYALFHSLACYRYGYRSTLINSEMRMDGYFSSGSPHGFSILFEDMSLNFHDKEKGVQLSSFRKRGERYPSLLEGEVNRRVVRVLVTTGQSRSGGSDELEANKKYLGTDAPKKCSATRSLVLKPSGGLISLWASAKLRTLTHGTEQIDSQRLGNADGFVWPPPRYSGINNNKEEKTEDSAPESSTHGALGGQALAVELMLCRANHLRSSADSIYEMSVVCIIAIDATEIIGGRSMHLGTEALLLKHELEVEIECRFNGIGYHVDAMLRMEEVKLECEAFSEWVEPRMRKQFSANSQLTIITRLSHIFLRSGLFEEHEDCLKKIRRLNRQLVGLSLMPSALANRSRKLVNHDHKTGTRELLARTLDMANFTLNYCLVSPWKLLGNCFLRYCECALSSLGRIFLLTVLWQATFTGIWICLGPKDKTPFKTVADIFWAYNFQTNSIGQFLFSAAAIWVALVHLGLIVAYLYSLVSRR